MNPMPGYEKDLTTAAGTEPLEMQRTIVDVEEMAMVRECIQRLRDGLHIRRQLLIWRPWRGAAVQSQPGEDPRPH